MVATANQSTTYTETEVNSALDVQANQATTYTKTRLILPWLQKQLINQQHIQQQKYIFLMQKRIKQRHIQTTDVDTALPWKMHTN